MSTFSRRRLLFGVGGALALTCGGGLARLTTGYAVGPDDRAIGLSVKQLAVVRALVEALQPEDGDLPSGLALGVHQRIDEEVWAAPDPIREDLRAAIELVEVLPLAWGWGGRFTRLSAEDREAVFVDLLNAGPKPVVQAASALRQLCLLFYWVRDETWGAISYDGPWVKTPRPPDSAVRYAELLAAARA